MLLPALFRLPVKLADQHHEKNGHEVEPECEGRERQGDRKERDESYQEEACPEGDSEGKTMVNEYQREAAEEVQEDHPHAVQGPQAPAGQFSLGRVRKKVDATHPADRRKELVACLAVGPSDEGDPGEQEGPFLRSEEH